MVIEIVCLREGGKPEDKACLVALEIELRRGGGELCDKVCPASCEIVLVYVVLVGVYVVAHEKPSHSRRQR